MSAPVPGAIHGAVPLRGDPVRPLCHPPAPKATLRARGSVCTSRLRFVHCYVKTVVVETREEKGGVAGGILVLLMCPTTTHTFFRTSQREDGGRSLMGILVIILIY